MEDIRFYNFEFELLDIEANFISSNWQVQFNAVGQFEAHFPLDSDIAEIAMNNPYLVAVQGKNTAIVTGKKAGEDFAVFGRTCNWLLTKRIVPAFEKKTGTAAALACGFVADAFADTENFICIPGSAFENTVSIEKDEYLPLMDVVQECLHADGGGNELVFDTQQKKWVFRVLCGSNRSLLLSEDNRNASGGEVCEDILEQCESGWYKQKQETDNGETYVWTKLDSAETTGVYRRECVLSAKTQEEAQRELSAMKKNISLTANGMGLKWRTDYELGDVVRVQIRLGRVQCIGEKKITGVHLWYEEGETGEQPIMEG